MSDNTDGDDASEEMGELLEEAEEMDELLAEVRTEREAWEDKMQEKHGCLPPTTYDKELGHDIVLNPNNERYPNHAEDRDVLTASIRHATELAIFLPRESGTCWRIQSDGMVMNHPVLEGTMIPVSTYKSDPDALPQGNYLGGADEAEMQEIWAEIEDDLRITVEDTQPPDGYGQAQEAIRWVELVDHDVERQPMGDMDPYIPMRDDWVRWVEEHDSPFAIIYRNCD